MRSWIWRISAVVVLATGLAWSGLAAAAEPLTPAQFRDAYVAELRKQAPNASIKVISETELHIKGGPDADEQIAYLDNAYRRYRADPAALEEVLARHVTSTTSTLMGTPSITAENAIVLVRQAEFSDDYEALMRAKPPKDGKAPGPLAVRPLPGNLVLVIASDQPTAYLYSSAADVVENLGSLDAAWTRAIANTEALIGEADGSEAGAIVVLTTRKGSGSSLLVVDSFWDKIEASGLGAPVVLLADRNTVAMAFEGNADSIRDLKLIARGLVEEPGKFDEPMLSSSLLIRRKGQWVLYADYPYR